MIAYLTGTLLERTKKGCIVLTASGIGYEVALPIQVRSGLPAKGEALSLYTSLIVREDAQELYGFGSFEERETFDVLVTISKVGAKTALAILSVFTPTDLRRIVLEEDVLSLTHVPGIGKKTAQHVFLELKDKLKIAADTALPTQGLGGKSALMRDVLDGLVGLGYGEEECAPIVRALLQKNPESDVATLLRNSLQALAKDG